MLVLFVSLVSAVSISGDVIINTSSTDSGYQNDLNLTTTNLSITSTGINFQDMNYTNGEMNVSINDSVLIDQINSTFNTTDFPFLSYSTNLIKNISNNFLKTLNATLTFDVNNCTNFTEGTYLSNSTAVTYTLNNTEVSCTGTRLTGFFTSIESAFQPFANIFTIVYGLIQDDSWQISIIGGLIGVSLLFIYMGTKLEDENNTVRVLLYLMSTIFAVAVAAVITHVSSAGAVSDTTIAFYTGTIYVFLTISSFFVINLLIDTFKLLHYSKK